MSRGERPRPRAFDPVRAAELEVEWWRLHREHQHDQRTEERALVQALVDLYSYVYTADPDAMRPAAQARVDAMDLSDRWVEARGELHGNAGGGLSSVGSYC